jgi:hypothetical protein
MGLCRDALYPRFLILQSHVIPEKGSVELFDILIFILVKLNGI